MTRSHSFQVECWVATHRLGAVCHRLSFNCWTKKFRENWLGIRVKDVSFSPPASSTTPSVTVRPISFDSLSDTCFLHDDSKCERDAWFRRVAWVFRCRIAPSDSRWRKLALILVAGARSFFRYFVTNDEKKENRKLWMVYRRWQSLLYL